MVLCFLLFPFAHWLLNAFIFFLFFLIFRGSEVFSDSSSCDLCIWVCILALVLVNCRESGHVIAFEGFSDSSLFVYSTID